MKRKFKNLIYILPTVLTISFIMGLFTYLVMFLQVRLSDFHFEPHTMVEYSAFAAFAIFFGLLIVTFKSAKSRHDPFVYLPFYEAEVNISAGETLKLLKGINDDNMEFISNTSVRIYPMSNLYDSFDNRLSRIVRLEVKQSSSESTILRLVYDRKFNPKLDQIQAPFYTGQNLIKFFEEKGAKVKLR